MNKYFIAFSLSAAPAFSFLKLSVPDNLKLSSNEACGDLEIVDPSSLHWNDKHIAPWFAQPSTVVYSSKTVTSIVDQIRNEIVPGLPFTFNQTFGFFQDAGCKLYIHGGAVRDFFLGIPPKDIDLEYSCSPDTLNSTCVKALKNKDLCNYYGNYFYLGKKEDIINSGSNFEELEGVNWNTTIFGSTYSKEYTTNAMSYGLNGNDVIIDIIGVGVNDTCGKKISIPVEMDEWNLWLTESEFIQNNGIAKLPRFWKLRSEPKNFDPVDNETLNFIVDNVKSLWNSKDYPVESIFRNFYCNNFGGAIKYISSDHKYGPVCLIPEPLDKSTVDKIKKYDEALSEDMGIEWFTDHITRYGINDFAVGHWENEDDNHQDFRNLWIANGVLAATWLITIGYMLFQFCGIWARVNYLDGLLTGRIERVGEHVDNLDHGHRLLAGQVENGFGDVRTQISHLAGQIRALQQRVEMEYNEN